MNKMFVILIFFACVNLTACGGSGDTDTVDDTTAPILSGVTSIGRTLSASPSYTFISDEPGSLAIFGSCSTTSIEILSGQNTITLNALANGSYNDCTMVVTDENGNSSEVFNIPPFTINDPASAAFVEINEGEAFITIPQTLANPVYSIVGGADKSLFKISTVTGNLLFITAPDYEASTAAAGNDIYDVRIKTENGIDAAVEQTIMVYVLNINDESNDLPIINMPRFYSVAENTAASWQASCDDPDSSGEKITISGIDAEHFHLLSGEIKLLHPLDYETPLDTDGDNIYQLNVHCVTGSNDSEQASLLALTFRVTDEAQGSLAQFIFPVDQSDLNLNEATSITVTVQIKDLENATAAVSQAFVNGTALEKHAENMYLWTANIPVNVGDTPLNLSANIDGQIITQQIMVKNTYNLASTTFDMYVDSDDQRLLFITPDGIASAPINTADNIELALLAPNKIAPGLGALNAQSNELYYLSSVSGHQLHKVDLENTANTTVTDLSLISTPRAFTADFSTKDFYFAGYNGRDLIIQRWNETTGVLDTAINYPNFTIDTDDGEGNISYDNVYVNDLAINVATQKLYVLEYYNGLIEIDLQTGTHRIVTSKENLYTNNDAAITYDFDNMKAWSSGGSWQEALVSIDLLTGEKETVLKNSRHQSVYTLAYDAQSTQLFVGSLERKLYRLTAGDVATQQHIYSAGIGAGFERWHPEVDGMHENGEFIDVIANQPLREDHESHYRLHPQNGVERISSYAINYGYSENGSSVYSPATGNLYGVTGYNNDKLEKRLPTGAKESFTIPAPNSVTTYHNINHEVLMVGNDSLIAFDVRTETFREIASLTLGNGTVGQVLSNAAITDSSENIVWVLTQQGLGRYDLNNGNREIVVSDTMLFGENWDETVAEKLHHFSVDVDADIAMIDYRGKLMSIDLRDYSYTQVRNLVDHADWAYPSAGAHGARVRGVTDIATQRRWGITHNKGIELESLISGERVIVYQ